MGGSTTRAPVRRLYEACKDCPDNAGIPGTFGVCQRGYENFYARASKTPACPKAAARHERFKKERERQALFLKHK